VRPTRGAPSRRRFRTAIPAAVAVASLSVSGGALAAGGGGTTPPTPPKLTDVSCVSNCGGVRKATKGSKVNLSGRHLSAVSKVLFNAKSGGRIKVSPVSVRARSVVAKVPQGAATGRPKVKDSYANSSRSPTTLSIVSPDQIPSSAQFKLRAASASPRKTYYYGTHKPTVTYLFSNSGPTDVRIDVVKKQVGVVDSWVEKGQEPNTSHTSTWNGLVGENPARNGAYKFRVGPLSGSMESTSDARFAYHRDKFPVLGRHSYGDGVGAPRAGHTHQGQDVMASCGVPLVAARGGRVQWKAYQSAAGYYLVIDGKKTGHDFAYMHMKKPSNLRKGQRVHTGQRIGEVGSTGDATACHLHFEEWSAPGWYEGGTFLRAVTKHLKLWDTWS
jgi:murein DD-endopeptidase MepM/ murein hydrolase activator NlpD